ncbi:MAG: ribosome biogenesis GTPase Der [Candidatus Nomurabacteria bacterium]|jgi:GTP-binding protein|nr:ribosome biogenesis GTPase Der [Candidatus Nomurabacteria bacterium]
MKLPTVAIIGQTNAGKSSLFNRLARSRRAIVAREEGTTRDNVMAKIHHNAHDFLLIDTAGLKNPEDDFEAKIQDQIDDAISASDLILVVVDGAKYFNSDDKEIARKVLRSAKPVFLVLNKTDLAGSLPDYEFAGLGLKNMFRVSAEHGTGVESLLDTIADNLPKARKAEVNVALKLALIGRPNVGKSSLFNTLAKKQQAIVANLSGTTRDVNSVHIRYENESVEILDTAGVRRAGKQEVGIEKFSVLRTMQAIDEADICLLLVDATAPHMALDQKLAGIIADAGKGIILVLTKWDLLTSAGEAADDVLVGHPETMVDFNGSKEVADVILAGLTRDFNFIPFAPVVITSSTTGKNVTKILELALKIRESRLKEVKTSELNRVLGSAVAAHPPAAVKGALPKPKYVVQTDQNPPWFVIHGTNLDKLHFSYKRYLENVFRDNFGFFGTPIKFSFRNSEKGRL